MRPYSGITGSPPKTRLNTPSTVAILDGINFIPQKNESDFISRGSFHSHDMVQMSEMIQLLSNENKALRRKLFLNGINLPEDSRKAMGISSNRFLIFQGSQQDGTMFSTLSGTSSPMRSRSARTLASSNPNSRPSTTPRKISRPATRDKPEILQKLDFHDLAPIPDIKRPTTGKTVAFAEDNNIEKVEPIKQRPRTAPVNFPGGRY